jgi:hypothetical protein
MEVAGTDNRKAHGRGPPRLCPWAFHTGQNTGFDLVQLKAKSPRLPGVAKEVSAASPAPLSPGGH